MLTSEAFIEITINEQHIKLAKNKIANRPIYNKSHRELTGNQVGFLGEAVIETYFQSLDIKFELVNDTRYDYKLFNSKTIEVKTKDRTVSPKTSYECSLPEYNHAHQLADYYIFNSLLRNKSDTDENLTRFKKCYILGIATPKLMQAFGKKWNAGETDPSNGTTFWTDCINIEIAKLHNFNEFVSWYKGK